MGSNPGSVKTFFFIFFYFFFSFFKYIESVLGSNIAPSPSPTPHFFIFLILYNTFLYIVQYLLFLVHIPHTPHHPYPQHCVHIHPDPRPTNPTPHLTPSATDPPPPDPPQKKKKFFFEFSQKLQFFVHIHSDPPTRPRPPPPPPHCNIPSFVEICPLVSEKIFESFLPYMGVGAILVM